MGKIYTIAFDGTFTGVSFSFGGPEPPEPEEPPTPPRKIQGHWVEPRSGRQLHIAPDGAVTADTLSDGVFSGRFFDGPSAFSLTGKRNDFLVVGYVANHQAGLVYSFGTENIYCRKGIAELRLLRWLKEQGL